MPELIHLQLLLATFAGWANHRQAQVIDYLVEENRVLKEQLGGKRLRLTDHQRRRLAAKGKVLGRRLLPKVATIVTPDTILVATDFAERLHQRLGNVVIDGDLQTGNGEVVVHERLGGVFKYYHRSDDRSAA